MKCVIRHQIDREWNTTRGIGEFGEKFSVRSADIVVAGCPDATSPFAEVAYSAGVLVSDVPEPVTVFTRLSKRIEQSVS
jgi:hypothetical protein